MNRNQIVDSLKRLYKNGKLSNEQIVKLFNEDKLTQAEYEYIIGKNE